MSITADAGRAELLLDGLTERAAARAPEHVALIQDEERLSYAALHS